MKKQGRKPVKTVTASHKIITTPAPRFVADGSDYSSYQNASPSRRNRAGSIDLGDKYIHIQNGMSPFHLSNNLYKVDKTIELTQKAYWNFGIVRNTIEIMTELSNSRMYLQGANKKARDFVGAWLERINLWHLKEQFFREYYRSGNVFMYRFDSEFQIDDIQKMTQIYGALGDNLKNIPLRYLILNPARICTIHNFNFINTPYYEILTGPEISALKYPKTKEDKALFDSLSPSEQEQVKNGVRELRILLDPARVHVVFSKKQDYEPFAVPFIFPVLEQINAHLELQRIDMAVARTLDRAILLITNGAEPDKGGVSADTLMKLQSLFQSESVSRTLVADYTTKGEWLVPDIDKLLGAKKYEEINKQIAIGLNAIFFQENEKFANASIKTKIFIERLKEPREAFINFLQAEIKKVCQLMNFKSYPSIMFEDITLKDEAEFIRLFTRMAELGILTPSQFFNALETGQLPDVNSEEYLTAIKEYKQNRDDGLFIPLVGASKPADGESPTGQVAGRPQGTKAPQTTKKVSPIGASFSMASVRDNYVLADALLAKVEAKAKSVHKLKELNDNQKAFCKLLSQAVMLNEDKKDWNTSVAAYFKKFNSPKQEVLDAVEKIAMEHNIDSQEATILYLSQIKS